jgi:hypothetical protein
MENHVKGRRCLKVDAPLIIFQHLSLVPLTVDPSRPTCISASENGYSILHRSHDGMSGMLFRASFFAKPRVVRRDEKEVNPFPNRLPDHLGENILITNEGTDPIAFPTFLTGLEDKGERNGARPKVSDRSDQFPQARNPSKGKGDVFAERN